ncbi:MAG: TetR/AcrR family transcriptional regulator [Deltaproteobacteria bacterium]|nr:TetR/AcrR family transcriptional regulator [Deltaproteobacteria bacterium]
MRSKLRSELIIKSAKKLFTQHGFHKTSVGDIASAINLTKASLYHYFRSKEEIFKEVVRGEAKVLFSRLRNITGTIGSVEEQFRSVVIAHIKETLSFPLLTRLFTQSPQRQASVATELRQEVFEQEVSLIEEILTKGQHEGCFNIARPKILAQALVAALHGIEMSSELQDAQTALKKYIEEFVQVLLRGIVGNDGVTVDGSIS